MLLLARPTLSLVETGKAPHGIRLSIELRYHARHLDKLCGKGLYLEKKQKRLIRTARQISTS
jgi:hypothetical protein